jgi:hypothetical protein
MPLQHLFSRLCTRIAHTQFVFPPAQFSTVKIESNVACGECGGVRGDKKGGPS